MIVFLAGPVDYWWHENWHTHEHYKYLLWREQIQRALIEAGHLVYMPWGAFKGAWDEKAQKVNDTALLLCDAVVYLTPPGVPAYGTDAEVVVAQEAGIPVFWAPPGDLSDVFAVITPLDDPYGSVHRKSYTKEHDVTSN